MTDCIFCRIIAGEVSSHLVYEDEHVVAFLDAFPAARGHLLVVPRRHEQLLVDLPFVDSTHIFGIVRKLDNALRGSLGYDAVSVLLRDGPAAGQEVPHLHVHLIPRFDGDGLGSAYPSGDKLSSDDALSLQDRIKSSL